MAARRSTPPALRAVPRPAKAHYRRKLTISLDPSLYATLVAYADEECVPTSRLVEVLIVHGLRRRGVPVRSILLEDDER